MVDVWGGEYVLPTCEVLPGVLSCVDLNTVLDCGVDGLLLVGCDVLPPVVLSVVLPKVLPNVDFSVGICVVPS